MLNHSHAAARSHQRWLILLVRSRHSLTLWASRLCHGLPVRSNSSGTRRSMLVCDSRCSHPVLKADDSRRIGISNALFRQEVGYCWARELSSMRVLGLGSGHFRALPRPEALCFGSVLASRASEGQGGGSAQGLNRMGAGIGGDQASWNRSKALAAARGGARAGKPRCVRILVITGDARWRR